MASHFSSIGFGVSRERFSELLEAAVSTGTRIPVKEHSAYYVLKPGGGPELWVGVTESKGSKDLLAVTPYFRGPTRFDARLEGLHPNGEFPFEGRADLWAVGRGGEDEPHPLSVNLADFSLGSSHATGEILSLPIAGFAHTLDWWRDEASYALAGPGLAPKAFIPIGMFSDPGAPPSSALFTGIIEAAQRITNTATGQEFVHIQVDTLSGRIDVVTDSGLVPETPTKGGIVKTTCWLCSTIT